MKLPTLPKTIYGKWQNDGDSKDDTFLRTDTDPESMVGQNEQSKVGVYKLVGTVIVANETRTINNTTVTRA